jgi:hypothetical protein
MRWIHRGHEVSPEEQLRLKQIVEDMKAKKYQEDVNHIREVVSKHQFSEEELRACSEPNTRPIKFYGTCEICGKQFAAKRSDKMTCESYACRKQLYRRTKKLGLRSLTENSGRKW